MEQITLFNHNNSAIFECSPPGEVSSPTGEQSKSSVSLDFSLKSFFFTTKSCEQTKKLETKTFFKRGKNDERKRVKKISSRNSTYCFNNGSSQFK
jgi:hypothetical protein